MTDRDDKPTEGEATEQRESAPAPGHPLVQFLRGVAGRFHEDRCFQVAAGLTFTTLLALVPLLMLALTILSMTPGFTGIAGRFDDMLAGHVLPDAIGRAMTRYFEQIAPQARRLTLIGVLGLFATALITMATIERAFNEIWLVPRRLPTARRFVMYWAVLTLGPLLIGASLAITSYVATLSSGLLGGAPRVAGVLTRFAPGVLTVAAFTLLYYGVPGRRVVPKHALIGGLVAGILFELTKRAFAWYVAGMGNYAMLYGTFAAVPAFLLWVYVSWTVTIIGAVIAAMLPDYGRMRREGRRPPGTAFCEAVDVLCVLARAHGRGEVLELAEVADRADLPRHRCDAVLQEMASTHWVGRLAGERWALLCHPNLVKISALYRLFATSPAALSTLVGQQPVSAALMRLEGALEDNLALTLHDVMGAAR
jgi:membrane protein